MRAMVLEETGKPLERRDVPVPVPGPGQVLLRVEACAVCRTDLHVVDGELEPPRLPLVPGHEIVGAVEAVGEGVSSPALGDRVGVPWLGWTCRRCAPCREGRENLCEEARFTGFHLDGGYAEYTVAEADWVVPIPPGYDPVAAAPLLCAGLIGYRAFRLAGPGERIGFYGFGSAAHLLVQLARHEGRRVHAFTRPGDEAGQEFARSLGATWAGGSDELPPEPLHAAVIFAPVGALVPVALRAVRPAGTVVCAGIHMSDIPAFPYRILWEERVLRSVANLTREDARKFFEVAPRVPVRARTETMPLAEANEALGRVRAGRTSGTLVLVP